MFFLLHNKKEKSRNTKYSYDLTIFFHYLLIFCVVFSKVSIIYLKNANKNYKNNTLDTLTDTLFLLKSKWENLSDI